MDAESNQPNLRRAAVSPPLPVPVPLPPAARIAALAPLAPLAPLAALAALALTPSCSASSAHPPALAECSARPDAACGVLGGGGGSSAPAEGGAGESDGGVIDDAGTCGTAGELLNAANAQCPVCIAASCCQAAAACTGACLSLVQCPSTAITSCESQYPAGISAYDDLAACVTQSCQIECPVLPLASAAD